MNLCNLTLDSDRVCRKFRQTASDGKVYEVIRLRQEEKQIADAEDFALLKGLQEKGKQMKSQTTITLTI